MTDNTADMGVTSPPYNKRENKKAREQNGEDATDNLPDDEYQQIEVLNEQQD